MAVSEEAVKAKAWDFANRFLAICEFPHEITYLITYLDRFLPGDHDVSEQYVVGLQAGLGNQIRNLEFSYFPRGDHYGDSKDWTSPESTRIHYEAWFPRTGTVGEFAALPVVVGSIEKAKTAGMEANTAMPIPGGDDYRFSIHFVATDDFEEQARAIREIDASVREHHLSGRA